MPAKTGIDAQWGFKTEVTVGVPVTVDTFWPLLSETMERKPDHIESQAIIAGRRMLTSDMWVPGLVKVSGGIQTELYTKGTGTIWTHMFGDTSSPFTPSDRAGDSLTMQLGKPGIGGTVHPFTYPGCKFTGFQFGFEAGKICTLGFDVDAMNEILHRSVADGVTNTDTSLTSATAAFTNDDVGKPVSGTGIAAGTTIASVTSATVVVLSAATTATATGVAVAIGVALASASYASALKPVYYDGGSVTIAGSAVKVKKGTLTGGIALDVDRFFIGQRTHDEALENDLLVVGAELEVEFTDLTQYRRYCNGTEHAMVLTFTGAGGFSLVATTNVRFDGKEPSIGGRGIVPQMLPVKCIASGADSTAISTAITEAS